jgi:hypothetical protein
MGIYYHRFSRLTSEITHWYTYIYIQREPPTNRQKVDEKVWKMLYDVNDGLFILILPY